MLSDKYFFSFGKKKVIMVFLAPVVRGICADTRELAA